MALKWPLNSAFSQVVGGLDSSSNVTVQKSSADSAIACPNGEVLQIQAQHLKNEKEENPNHGFRVPVHYPRYSKADYEKMEEWRLDLLLQQYGLCFEGTLPHKRAFAIGAFLWPDQL